MSTTLPEFNKPLYIDTPEALAAFSKQLMQAPWIAVDTEFLREKTYYPILCLIQVASPQGALACIDPIALNDLNPLLDVFSCKDVLKVFHACSQDQEILYYLSGAVPAPIFDTQIAAPLLGMREQMGYAALVTEMTGTSLEKAYSRTDWSLRPLNQKQIDYALDDVRYLSAVYLDMHQQLSSRNRLDWLKTEFAEYEAETRYSNDPEKAWMRVRAANRLKGGKLTVLQQLAKWREQTAQKSDRPRNWIMRDDVMMDIAKQLPDSIKALSSIRQFPDATVKKHGEYLLALVAQAINDKPESLPDVKRPVKTSANQEAQADILMAQLGLLAEQHQLNPVSIATRKHLLGLVAGNRDVPVMQGWRYEVAGKELLAMLEGQRSLSIQKHQLKIDGI